MIKFKSRFIIFKEVVTDVSVKADTESVRKKLRNRATRRFGFVVHNFNGLHNRVVDGFILTELLSLVNQPVHGMFFNSQITNQLFGLFIPNTIDAILTRQVNGQRFPSRKRVVLVDVILYELIYKSLGIICKVFFSNEG